MTTPGKTTGDTDETKKTRRPLISRQDLLDDLKKVYANNDGRLSANLYQKEGRYSVGTIVSRFKSWNDAVVAADLPLSTMGRREGTYVISLPDLIADIDRTMSAVSPLPLTLRRYEEYGFYSFGTACRRFGKWTDAIEAVHKRREILADMASVAKNGIISERTYSRSGKFAVSDVEEILGSMDAAAEAVGLTYLDAVSAEVLAATNAFEESDTVDTRNEAFAALIRGHSVIERADGTSIQGVKHLESLLAHLDRALKASEE